MRDFWNDCPCHENYGPPVNISPVVAPCNGYEDNIHPVSRPPILAPCHESVPPSHTQIQPRCFTCCHFEMCKYKKDYLKMITIMQKDLGAPQKDYELTNKYIEIPHFVGFPFADWDKYLPKEVIFDNSDNKGKIFSAKFNGINFVNIVYKDCKYFILLQFVYNAEDKIYELESCKEAFYCVEYELNKKSIEEIQTGLTKWREVIINAKMPAPLPPPPHKDIIDTTHFSASLNCDMYEWNKDSYEDAIKKMIKKYPHGIPIDENGKALYHIITYHIENGEVPYAPLFVERETRQTKYYFPPKPFRPSKPPKRRDDL